MSDVARAGVTVPALPWLWAGLLVLGGVLAVVGFFVIPVVGVIIGGVLGIYLAEYVRLREPGRAWDSTRAALVAIGVGLLIELTAGVLMFGVWLLGVWVT